MHYDAQPTPQASDSPSRHDEDSYISLNTNQTLTADDLSWILGSPSPNSAYTAASAGTNNTNSLLSDDALLSSFIHTPPSNSTPSQSTGSTPGTKLDPDFFEQELEQAFGLDLADLDSSALDSLNLQIAQSQANPAFPVDLHQLVPDNSLFASPPFGIGHTPNAVDLGAHNYNAFAVPRSSGPLSNYDAESSVYSEPSNYLSVHSAGIFPTPTSPTYQSMELPDELDLSRYNLSANSPSATRPRSNYAVSNVSSVAPSSLAGMGGGRTASAYSGEGGDSERKHVCPHCPRAFARAYNLKTHIATHDPQRPKPYKCPYASCGRGFSRKHDLGRHVSSVHEKGQPEHTRDGQSERGGVSERGGEKPKVNGGLNGSSTQKIWCDGCGRGWVKGLKSGCVCDEQDKEMGKVKWEEET